MSKFDFLLVEGVDELRVGTAHGAARATSVFLEDKTFDEAGLAHSGIAA